MSSWFHCRFLIKGAIETKYKFGLLERWLCPDNSDTSFVADFSKITEILKKACEAVATPQPLSGSFYTASQNIVLCDWRLLNQPIAKADWTIVVGPLVRFDRITWEMLTCHCCSTKFDSFSVLLGVCVFFFFQF